MALGLLVLVICAVFVLLSWRTHKDIKALRMAKAANDAKSASLSSVSHDIRSPMNAIIGFLTLMWDEADNLGMVMEYTH